MPRKLGYCCLLIFSLGHDWYCVYWKLSSRGFGFWIVLLTEWVGEWVSKYVVRGLLSLERFLHCLDSGDRKCRKGEGRKREKDKEIDEEIFSTLGMCKGFTYCGLVHIETGWNFLHPNFEGKHRKTELPLCRPPSFFIPPQNILVWEHSIWRRH